MPDMLVPLHPCFAERPADVPAHCLIWNAPRPLSCSPDAAEHYLEWGGDFYHGIFYAATDPADPLFGKRNRDNIRLDAWLLVYVDRTQAIAEARAHLLGRYETERVDVEYGLSVMAADERAFFLLDHYRSLHEEDTCLVTVDRLWRAT